MTRIAFVVGARPNFMKAAPVLAAMHAEWPEIETLLIHTGQHYDAQMSAVFLRELGLPDPDVSLGIGSGTHGEQTARALTGIESVLLAERPDLVVVAGDVNSTLAGALAAVKLDIAVAHIEAGLRSFDRSMPEEHNRRVTDHLSSILLCHSHDGLRNLEHEGIEPANVHLVGNTMIDSVLLHLGEARRREPWVRLGLKRRGYGLITLHRPGLVDDPNLLSRTVEALIALSREIPLVFPVHPRTRERLDSLGLTPALDRSRMVVIEPCGYFTFLGLEAEAEFVLTDSGGVQEETSALGIPCFTLRPSTERPVTVELGTNTILGARPDRISEIPVLVKTRRLIQPIPLWDGAAGTRAATVLARAVGESAAETAAA